jgi:hypothetical protein
MQPVSELQLVLHHVMQLHASEPLKQVALLQLTTASPDALFFNMPKPCSLSHQQVHPTGMPQLL